MMHVFVIASPLKRILAASIDLALTAAVVVPVAWGVGLDALALFIAFFIVTCSYHSVFFVRYRCASLGQSIMRIQTVTLHGHAVGLREVFDRTVLQFLCPAIFMLLMHIINIATPSGPVLVLLLVSHTCVVCFWAYWYALAVFTPRKQALHDLICGTIVTVKKRTSDIP
ncbi:RDD family protein [Candidatus Anaplasma sp. TIGMIC]|uniref:RDD family protein n=1 Tax=Candidatus Anaplasma sp. TIGMIC TaxID=3020713 RepID=UPI0039779665